MSVSKNRQVHRQCTLAILAFFTSVSEDAGEDPLVAIATWTTFMHIVLPRGLGSRQETDTNEILSN